MKEGPFSMVKITVDITGYFYHQEVDVPKTATVFEVMREASNAGATAPSDKPRMLFSADPNGEFLSEIIVLHRNFSAKSRQVTAGGTPRQYNNGFYSFSDSEELVPEIGPNGVVRFAPRDPGASRALAWQFYVYKKTELGLVDLSRSKLGGLERKVEAFTVAKPFEEGEDDAEYEVVWRLIALALREDPPVPGRLVAFNSLFGSA